MKQKPILFLDFDRTLFDTDRFYDWLGVDRYSRILDLLAGTIAAPDFSLMIYPDTVPFLEEVKKTHRLVLLTYTVNTTLQRRKIRGSKLVPFFDDIIMTKESKGIAVKNYLIRTEHSEKGHTFVDDTPKNIDDMKMENPEIRTVRIERVLLTAQELIHHTEPDLLVSSLSAILPLLFL